MSGLEGGLPDMCSKFCIFWADPSGYQIKECGMEEVNDGKDPIKWFGGMVSPCLKSAQTSFMEGKMGCIIKEQPQFSNVLCYILSYSLVELCGRIHCLM